MYEDHMCTIVRRELTMMTKPGAIANTCSRLVRGIDGASYVGSPTPLVRFSNGSLISFEGIKLEGDVEKFQGSQMNFIGVDEATQLSQAQVLYLLSRNRGENGERCSMRLTCNPDPDSFLRDWIDWYLLDDGFPDYSKSGKIRFFIQLENTIIWGNTRQELIDNHGVTDDKILSFQFIPAKVDDNKTLVENNKKYKARLEGLGHVEKMRLLHGNWNIREEAGKYFKPAYFGTPIDRKELPPLVQIARGWDLASTEGSGDYTASILIGRDQQNNFYIMDMDYVQYSPYKVEQLVLERAHQDGPQCVIRMPQDPGQAGKSQMLHMRRVLAGFTVRSRTMTQDKETRAMSLSSASEGGLVKIVRGDWNEKFLAHAEAFPPVLNSPDIIDAAVEAFDEVTINCNIGSNSTCLPPVALGNYSEFGSYSNNFTFGGVF